jgi:hypothetical protein
MHTKCGIEEHLHVLVLGGTPNVFSAKLAKHLGQLVQQMATREERLEGIRESVLGQAGLGKVGLVRGEHLLSLARQIPMQINGETREPLGCPRVRAPVDDLLKHLCSSSEKVLSTTTAQHDVPLEARADKA